MGFVGPLAIHFIGSTNGTLRSSSKTNSLYIQLNYQYLYAVCEGDMIILLELKDQADLHDARKDT
jgi:hypothetical protein